MGSDTLDANDGGVRAEQIREIFAELVEMRGGDRAAIVRSEDRHDARPDFMVRPEYLYAWSSDGEWSRLALLDLGGIEIVSECEEDGLDPSNLATRVAASGGTVELVDTEDLPATAQELLDDEASNVHWMGTKARVLFDDCMRIAEKVAENARQPGAEATEENPREEADD